MKLELQALALPLNKKDILGCTLVNLKGVGIGVPRGYFAPLNSRFLEPYIDSLRARGLCITYEKGVYRCSEIQELTKEEEDSINELEENFIRADIFDALNLLPAEIPSWEQQMLCDFMRKHVSNRFFAILSARYSQFSPAVSSDDICY